MLLLGDDADAASTAAADAVSVAARDAGSGGEARFGLQRKRRAAKLRRKRLPVGEALLRERERESCCVEQDLFTTLQKTSIGKFRVDKSVRNCNAI